MLARMYNRGRRFWIYGHKSLLPIGLDDIFLWVMRLLRFLIIRQSGFSHYSWDDTRFLINRPVFEDIFVLLTIYQLIKFIILETWVNIINLLKLTLFVLLTQFVMASNQNLVYVPIFIFFSFLNRDLSVLLSAPMWNSVVTWLLETVFHLFVVASPATHLCRLVRISA